MAATVAQIARLRRMTGADEGDYADADLGAAIELYPVMDAAGYAPYLVMPGGIVVNGLWTATYDLNSAAADVLDEMLAAVVIAQSASAGSSASSSVVSEFSVAGASFKLGGASTASASFSDAVTNLERRARFYRSRRSPRAVSLVGGRSGPWTVESN